MARPAFAGGALGAGRGRRRPAADRNPSCDRPWNCSDAAQATLTLEENVHRVDVTAVDGTGWHVRLSQVFDDLKEGATYTVRFRARADMPRPIQLYGQIVEADFHGIGLNEVVPLTADWQSDQREFRAKDLAASNMIQFHFGERTGTVWIADIKITRATK